jgi:uncharacterized protein (DUF2252 family)
LIEQGNVGRLPELIPLRHGRMLPSPFIYYRGAALHMAVDLAGTPATGIHVQACGDAHLGNFRCFATPERRVNFDIHDLDETLPAPWEWDIKRLTTSFVLASRTNGLSEADARDPVLACVCSYRNRMAVPMRKGGWPKRKAIASTKMTSRNWSVRPAARRKSKTNRLWCITT